MKVVAVSQRVDFLSARCERRDAIDQRFCAWLSAAGYLPVPLPNVLSASAAERASPEHARRLQSWLEAVRPSAVALSGGNDIGENAERDFTEAQLLQWAAARSEPVLGICRGMQMMAVWSGAALKPVEGHGGTRHALRGRLDGEVNSFHDFALMSCPRDFEILAVAEDGEVEAMRHKLLPWEGWMWHPEREATFAERDLMRLRALFGS